MVVILSLSTPLPSFESAFIDLRICYCNAKSSFNENSREGELNIGKEELNVKLPARRAVLPGEGRDETAHTERGERRQPVEPV
jgi:hypothetical protein